MRHVVIALACCLLLAGCFGTPKPFEHEAGDDTPFRPNRDQVEVSINALRDVLAAEERSQAERGVSRVEVMA